jgi:hypothetical protein
MPLSTLTILLMCVYNHNGKSILMITITKGHKLSLNSV